MRFSLVREKRKKSGHNIISVYLRHKSIVVWNPEMIRENTARRYGTMEFSGR